MFGSSLCSVAYLLILSAAYRAGRLVLSTLRTSVFPEYRTDIPVLARRKSYERVIMLLCDNGKYEQKLLDESLLQQTRNRK